jgi:IS1 family transposase
VWISPKTDFGTFELDEIFWFIKQKADTETHENTYIMTMISRVPRQIVGFAVDNTKAQSILQGIVDSVPAAERYCTDGYYGYADVVFPGKHIQNKLNKNDTYIVEGTNADLRHYIPGLARRNRCFYRTLETFIAVLSIFIDAYNKFGEAKLIYHQKYPRHRDLPFSFLDFL